MPQFSVLQQYDRPRMVLATPGTDYHVSELFDLNLACLDTCRFHFDNNICSPIYTPMLERTTMKNRFQKHYFRPRIIFEFCKFMITYFKKLNEFLSSWLNSARGNLLSSIPVY